MISFCLAPVNSSKIVTTSIPVCGFVFRMVRQQHNRLIASLHGSSSFHLRVACDAACASGIHKHRALILACLPNDDQAQGSISTDPVLEMVSSVGFTAPSRSQKIGR